jgi:hypothetical protein
MKTSILTQRFLHFTLIFVIVAAFPLEGYCQRLPVKAKIPNAHLKPTVGTRPIPVIIPKVNEYTLPHRTLQGSQPIIKGVLIDTTVLARLNQQKNICRIDKISTLIDTTFFTELNQLHRINKIIEMSKERVEASRNHWLSFDILKDPSFVYAIYKFEQARFQMLLNIASNSKYATSIGESLKMMESIYNREVIVLPYLEIDIPRGVN